jgi:hypothetical protein
VVETGSDNMVMEAAWVLCDFSLLVSQLNHLDPSLNTLDDAHQRFSQKKIVFWKQKMTKSAKTKVDDLLAKEFHLLSEQNIHMIRAAMEALVNGAEKVSTTKLRQF